MPRSKYLVFDLNNVYEVHVKKVRTSEGSYYVLIAGWEYGGPQGGTSYYEDEIGPAFMERQDAENAADGLQKLLDAMLYADVD